MYFYVNTCEMHESTSFPLEKDGVIIKRAIQHISAPGERAPPSHERREKKTKNNKRPRELN